MLLASSVNTPIDNNRSHLLALRMRVLCESGLNADERPCCAHLLRTVQKMQMQCRLEFTLISVFDSENEENNGGREGERIRQGDGDERSHGRPEHLVSAFSILL